MNFDSSSDSESEISDSSSESDCDMVAYDSADEADCDMFLLVGTIVMSAHLAQDNYQISVPRDQIIPVQRLNLMAMSDFDARRHFRLTAFQLPALAVAFGLQGPMKTNARDRFLGLEGLFLVLRRLVFPSRWTDLTPLFGRSQTSLCRIFWCCANHIYAQFQHLLAFNPLCFQHRLQEFAQAVSAVSGYVLPITGFIDGSLRRTCTPFPDAAKLPPGVSHYALQRAAYNGHKKYLSFSSLSLSLLSFSLDLPLSVVLSFRHSRYSRRLFHSCRHHWLKFLSITIERC
jgi:hypothetical protein